MLVVTEVETLCYDNRESVSNVRDVRWRGGGRREESVLLLSPNSGHCSLDVLWERR